MTPCIVKWKTVGRYFFISSFFSPSLSLCLYPSFSFNSSLLSQQFAFSPFSIRWAEIYFSEVVENFWSRATGYYSVYVLPPIRCAINYSLRHISHLPRSALRIRPGRDFCPGYCCHACFWAHTPTHTHPPTHPHTHTHTHTHTHKHTHAKG